MRDVFAQPPDQMPDAYHEESHQNRLAHYAKRLPQRRLDHCYKERRKEKSDRGEDGALALHVLAPIILEYLIDDPVPASLGSDIAGPLSMRVVVQSEESCLPRALIELLIVECSFLRIDQRVVGKRQERELARRLL